MIQSHGLKLLSTLLETEESNPSILKLDMFGPLPSLPPHNLLITRGVVL